MLRFVLVTISGPSEAESFQLEMSGLLSELACPYSVLAAGDVTLRFLNKDDCLLLLGATPCAFYPGVFSFQYIFSAFEP